jgi:hypothetical protein
MSKIRAVVVDPDAPNRLALADVERPLICMAKARTAAEPGS